MAYTLSNIHSKLVLPFLVLAYPGSPRQNPESRKMIVVVLVVVVTAIASFTIASSYIMNSSGDKEQPCLTPPPI